MIVKNESHIIEKTLNNICQYIDLDYWVICDTGSTDNTVEIIKNFFKSKNIKGEILYEPWVNFEHNRNVALKACLGKAEYVLIFDADDQFSGEFVLPPLDKDSYFLKLCSEDGTTRYLRKILIKNDGCFAWKGVLHEFLEENRPITTGEIVGDYAVVSGRKGARSLDPNKYRKDAEMLKEAFLLNKDLAMQPRYAFYCAQSYRDAKQIKEAMIWYQKRIEIDLGWSEEIYCSYEQLGLLFEEQGQYSQAIETWQKGILFDHTRAECWYHIARRHSWNEHPILAYCFASQSIQIAQPTGNRLFINTAIYQYWCWYEYTLNAAKLEKFQDAYYGLKSLIEYAPIDLLDYLTPYYVHMHPYLVLDRFDQVAKIGTFFRQNQRNDLFNLLLNGKS